MLSQFLFALCLCVNMTVSEKCLYCSISGNRFVSAVHPPLHKLQPEPTGGREGAEAQSEDWTDPGGSATENLQGLLPGGSVCRHMSFRVYIDNVAQ